MEQNKIRTYIFYAIGEILLVVIGILIALQVNNWNEERKTQLKSRQYLVSLSEEIENNIETLTTYQVSLKGMADTTHYFLNLMNGDVRPEDSALAALTKEVGPVYRSEISRSAVNDIIRSGSLETITDKRFKKNLQLIPRYYDSFENTMNESEKEWLNFTKPYYHQHANLLAMWDTIEEYQMPEPEYEPEYNAFYRNRDFTNLMVTRLRHLTNLKRETEVAITNLQEVNRQIYDYIYIDN